MPFDVSILDFETTKSFSTLVLDYLVEDEKLTPFYQHPCSLSGIEAAIEARKKFNTNRKLLAEQLAYQYRDVALTPLQQNHLNHLKKNNCFTITAAHQPNIFTGHLYFIYKIIHALKMANELKLALPQYNFVPVYYMGTEDADLEELGEVVVNGKRLKWETNQTGAVGRMHIDKAFIKIIKEISNQLSVEEFGPALMQQIETCYTLGKTIEQATFEFVNNLFADKGLIILLPDVALLKKSFEPIVKKELVEQFSYHQLQQTIKQFPKKYKVQASGREINLFYLQNDRRERIVAHKDLFKVENTNLEFTKEALLEEVEKAPLHFSANVILRPLYQEYILPNLVFIGGGGELAYWLELKAVFSAAEIPYPVVMLRNSLLMVNKKTLANVKKLKMELAQFFETEPELVKKLVYREAQHKVSLSEEKFNILKIYSQLRKIARAVDISLEQHVWALQANAVGHLDQLEKKLVRTSKREFTEQIKKIKAVKKAFFPAGVLQERVEGLLYFYSKYGPEFLQQIYLHSPAMPPKFIIMAEQETNPLTNPKP